MSFTPRCDTIKKSYLSTAWNYIISCAVEFSGLYGSGSTEEDTTMKLANDFLDTKKMVQNMSSSHILRHSTIMQLNFHRLLFSNITSLKDFFLLEQ